MTSNIIGKSDNIMYDEDAYKIWKKQSIEPMDYMLAVYSHYNADECDAGVGLNHDYMGNNGATLTGPAVAKSQQLVDLDSIFSNRNVRLNKGETGNLNPINPISEYELIECQRCQTSIAPKYSRLSNPINNYRGMSINRFYDIGANPQVGTERPFIYYTNSTLQARDNFKGFDN